MLNFKQQSVKLRIFLHYVFEFRQRYSYVGLELAQYGEQVQFISSSYSFSKWFTYKSSKPILL